MCDMSSRPSTWYEEERSRILYTCEEKFDGNMVMLVMHLENELKKVKAERDALQAERDALMEPIATRAFCCDCKYDKLSNNDEPCNHCLFSGERGKPDWEWHGIQDKKVKSKPLTLENVKPGEVLFIEFFDHPDIERVEIVEGFAPALVGYYEEFGGACRHNVDEISYGQYWRCWASRPTEEERAAAPWDQKGSERA